ncbi:MoaD/ThiS family protein [Halopenitus sp. H-Gu1]|uniref:MoaD/ThiS family protein n=1 Tax=Halopenitus sp. H-Gu1 TaxID=3242697 RepID=UPI00359F12D4
MNCLRAEYPATFAVVLRNLPNPPHELSDVNDYLSFMEVTVYGPLRAATGGKQVHLEFDGGTVREAIDALVERYPRAKPHLFGDDGRPEASVRVSVDGESAELEDPCPADASIGVHPAMRGG